MIYLSIPDLRGNEWKYLKECLDTNWITSVGHFLDDFENSLASFVGAKHAVACASGTAYMSEPKIENTSEEKRSLECRHCGGEHF